MMPAVTPTKSDQGHTSERERDWKPVGDDLVDAPLWILCGGAEVTAEEVAEVSQELFWQRLVEAILGVELPANLRGNLLLA